jgi:hypothetical protein
MPESRRRRPKKKSQAQSEPQQPPTPSRPPKRRIFWSAFVVFATILGAAAGAMTFLPHVSFEDHGARDTSNTWSESFIASNIGQIPLTDVRITLGFCYLEVGGIRKITSDCDNPGGLLPSKWVKIRLSVDEKFEIILWDAFDKLRSGPITKADITFIVRFNPFLIPWSREARFRFITELGGNNSLIWRPTPPD